MSSFSEDRLVEHFSKLKARLHDPFAELVASYKQLAVENIKTRSTIQGEVERSKNTILKQMQDEFVEKVKGFESDK